MMKGTNNHSLTITDMKEWKFIGKKGHIKSSFVVVILIRCYGEHKGKQITVTKLLCYVWCPFSLSFYIQLNFLLGFISFLIIFSFSLLTFCVYCELKILFFPIPKKILVCFSLILCALGKFSFFIFQEMSFW